MEDYDSPVNRKRPRLDSGSGVESLSIDSSAVPASDMDLSPDSRPAGKMTINVKSPTAEMTTDSVDPTAALPTSPPPPSTHPDATPENAISISSSPALSSHSQSPHIEVATPEDVDQAPQASNWKPLEEVMRDQDQEQDQDQDEDQAAPEIVEVHSMTSLVRRFPKLLNRASALENLTRANLMIERCKMTRNPPEWHF